MRSTEEISRAVAKAMAWQPSEDGPSYHEIRKEVVSAITAALDAERREIARLRAEQGWRMVPEEATEEMYQRGGCVLENETKAVLQRDGREELAREVYAAMLAASPPPGADDSGEASLARLQATHWHCKDFADGWISFDSAAAAFAYQRETGCAMRIVYAPDARIARAKE